MEKLLNWLNTRTTRELIILTLASLLIIYWLWHSLLISPLSQLQDSIQTTINNTQKTLTNLQAQIQALNTTNTQQTNKLELQQQNAQLIKQLATIDKALSQYKQQFISPQQLLTALQSILSASQNLSLVRLENLPAQVITKTNTNETVFAHTFIIELRGNYFATLRYLQLLEQLQWFLYWDDFNYQVTNYPEAKITIKLHVLSNEEKLINV